MKKSIMGYLGLALIICIVVMASGCTSTDNTSVKNKTFAKGGITFEYPGTWSDNKTFNYAEAPTKQIDVLGTLGDDKVSLAVSSYNLTKYPIGLTIEEAARLDYSDTSGGVIMLSFNNSANNNITFYEVIYTSKDPVSNDTYKNYKIYFGKEEKIIYQMIFKTTEADFANNYPLMRQIQNTIRYT